MGKKNRKVIKGFLKLFKVGLLHAAGGGMCVGGVQLTVKANHLRLAAHQGGFGVEDENM